MSLRGSRLIARGFLFGVGEGGFAHPGAFVVSAFARGEAFAIARAVAFDHLEKFIPIDRAEIVVAARFVPF